MDKTFPIIKKGEGFKYKLELRSWSPTKSGQCVMKIDVCTKYSSVGKTLFDEVQGLRKRYLSSKK